MFSFVFNLAWIPRRAQFQLEELCGFGHPHISSQPNVSRLRAGFPPPRGLSSGALKVRLPGDPAALPGLRRPLGHSFPVLCIRIRPHTKKRKKPPQKRNTQKRNIHKKETPTMKKHPPKKKHTKNETHKKTHKKETQKTELPHKTEEEMCSPCFWPAPPSGRWRCGRA